MTNFVKKTKIILKLSIAINSTDPYSQPHFECYQLQIVGGVCLLLAVSGLVFNSLLLYMSLRKKEMRNSAKLFLIVLTILNLLGCLCEMPFIIISNFNCQ